MKKSKRMRDSINELKISSVQNIIGSRRRQIRSIVNCVSIGFKGSFIDENALCKISIEIKAELYKCVTKSSKVKIEAKDEGDGNCSITPMNYFTRMLFLGIDVDDREELGHKIPSKGKIYDSGVWYEYDIDKEYLANVVEIIVDEGK